MISKLTSGAILFCAAASVACSSSGGSGGGEPGVEGLDALDEPDESDEPTGSGLPNNVLSGTNGTMPCQPLLDTGYAGDELCVLPAEPGTGAFFHAGPTDYDDPEQVALYILEPNEESTEYHITESSNDDMVWFRDQYYRMRPGSHHLIMYTLDLAAGEDPPEVGWHRRSDVPRGGPIGGTQVYAMDFPEGGQIAPEDVNLVRPLGARQRLAFEMHYVNPSDQPILREAWVNLMDNPIPASDRVILGAPFTIGRMDVPPHTTQIYNYQHTMPAGPNGEVAETRFVSFFGHRHASTPRFSIWLNRNGSRDLVYEDYDWAETREFFYNTVIQNPAPNPSTGTPGAATGLLFVHTGDILEWECEITNTLDVNLTFGNEVYTKEMCNVFGTLTSTGSIVLFARPTPTVTTL
jgi:hypothetical protein